MAKRKSKSKNHLIFTAVACLFGLAAVLMMFAPAVVIADTDSSFTGVQTAFGYSKTLLGQEIPILEVNILALVAYMLPIAGIIVLAISGRSSMLSFIGAAVFIASGVCALLMVETFPKTLIGSDYVDTTGVWELGIGAILSGAFSCSAGLVSIGKVVVK